MNIKAEIITIGDEILIGQIVDTNSAWIGQKLNLAGISINQITSVSDNKEHIITALKEAEQRADIIFTTGGLGPTKDDITKHTLCEYFNTKLVFSEEAYQDVERIFISRNKEVTPINRKQAEVPANCTVIRNYNGTAPCMWFETKSKKIIVSMPGVPYEMKALMENQIIPKLKERFQLPYIHHTTVLTEGVGESFLSELISNWEDSLKEKNIKLAYLPSPGVVKLRLSSTGDDKEQIIKNINSKIEELKKIIPQYIYGIEVFGEEKETLENIVGNLLRTKKKTLSIAESCTGGYISHLITSISGSSEYYIGSIVSYAYEIKMQELSVTQETLNEFGAVSKETVEQLAKAIKEKYKTDYSIATSGIAGPLGGTPDKPVGTVWIAIGTPDKIISEKFLFGENRERNIRKASLAALNMLRKELEKK